MIVCDKIKYIYKRVENNIFDFHRLNKDYVYTYNKNDIETLDCYNNAKKLINKNWNNYIEDLHTGIRITVTLTPDNNRWFTFVRIEAIGTYHYETFKAEDDFQKIGTSFKKLGINIKKLRNEYMNSYKNVDIDSL